MRFAAKTSKLFLKNSFSVSTFLQLLSPLGGRDPYTTHLICGMGHFLSGCWVGVDIACC